MKKAVGILSEFLLDYTHEYPICVKSASELDKERFRLIYIGTKDNNDYIAHCKTDVPQVSEGYAMKIKDDMQ